jgi:hypothetical protein
MDSSGGRAPAYVLATLVLVSLAGAGSGAHLPRDLGWPPYALEEASGFGDYCVCTWASLDASAPSFYRVVTIERGGQLLASLDWATGLGELSGEDIDGSGWPNLIVEAYSGGAHCCFATYVFDLAETLVSVDLPPSPGGNAAAAFVDIERDGIYEVVTADDSFVYLYCAYAGSPAVRVVLAYDAAERRYIPASPTYRELYAGDIARDLVRAENAGCAGADLGWDGTPKCEVLPLVLDYLYSGDEAAAWGALECHYDGPDRDAFRAEIESIVGASPYFVTSARR